MDAPSFRCYTPCEVVSWAVAGAVVFVGGSVLIQYATRPRGVEALDADHWLRFDMTFLVYGIASVLIVVAAAVVISLIKWALHHTARFVLCCHACRLCCGRRAGAAAAHAVALEEGHRSDGAGCLSCGRHAPSHRRHWSGASGDTADDLPTHFGGGGGGASSPHVRVSQLYI